MLKSKIYKTYYPLKNVSDVFHMTKKDKSILIKWLNTIKTDIDIYNFQKARKGGMQRGIYLFYDRDISALTEKISKMDTNSCEIDERDINFLNNVIYRHKYIGIISMYCFPCSSDRKEKCVQNAAENL